jgi:Glycosyl hydrolase family 71
MAGAIMIGRRFAVAVLASIMAALTMLVPAPGRAVDRRTADSPVPVLAYYYIWFNHASWNRAKTDYPAVGRYSSDDATVMRTHVRWAKAAGIDGFIVSWKRTETLDRRLASLVEIAADEDFKLAIIYQGLDFSRHPLQVGTIRADLTWFASRYATSPVFRLFDQPLVIWSGTWEFSVEAVASVSKAVRSRVLLLASEKNLSGYQRLAGLVDGDAYYWSSVDPAVDRNHAAKLTGMAAAVHERDGLWIAPAAPGFDARLIGGHRVVERANGATLRHQLQTALGASPDAVGLISWNEFSENSHLEPSLHYGTQALDVLSEVLNAPGPAAVDLDSSAPEGPPRPRGPLVALGVGFVALTVLSLVAVAFRRRPPGAAAEER